MQDKCTQFRKFLFNDFFCRKLTCNQRCPCNVLQHPGDVQKNRLNFPESAPQQVSDQNAPFKNCFLTGEVEYPFQQEKRQKLQ